VTVLLLVLDLTAVAATLLAAWLWFQASRRRHRRLSRHEVIDAADLNRMVVAMNRSQILNARAALATAGTALVLGLRLVTALLAG
jgi:hypothetical protein